MILIVDPANDRGISELYKNLKNEGSPVEASIVINEKLLAIIAKEAIEVLIYHAGGRAGITINEVYENIDQLLSHRGDKNSFIYLSGGPDYRAIGSKKGLKLTSPVTQFTKDINKMVSQRGTYYDSLKEYCKRKVGRRYFSYFLHLFLSLDIDMQALEATKDQEGYLNNMYTDLEKLYKSGEYKDGEIDEHYRRKLYTLWRHLGAFLESNQTPLPDVKDLVPINNPSNNLLKLAGFENGNREKSPIYKFFESLDIAKKNDMDVTAEDLCKPFNLVIEVNGKKEEIKSLHNWYCALASCLSEAEGCEGK